MKEELDTDFCNYLATAIEQEEHTLADIGATPFVPPPQTYGGLPPAEVMAEEREEQALAAAEAQGLPGGAAAARVPAV